MYFCNYCNPVYPNLYIITCFTNIYPNTISSPCCISRSVVVAVVVWFFRNHWFRVCQGRPALSALHNSNGKRGVNVCNQGRSALLLHSVIRNGVQGVNACNQGRSALLLHSMTGTGVSRLNNSYHSLVVTLGRRAQIGTSSPLVALGTRTGVNGLSVATSPHSASRPMGLQSQAKTIACFELPANPGHGTKLCNTTSRVTPGSFATKV